MENLKEADIKDLAFRLAEIRKEQDALCIEYNKIVHEIWDRIPSLQTDQDLQYQKLEEDKQYGKRRI